MERKWSSLASPSTPAPAAGTVTRSSNLELFRIISMLLIVAHHYVVNSGLTATDGPIFADPLSGASLFLLIAGAYGKVGINCFVLITGYFMCRSNISLRKFLKLYGEILFYNLIIYGIFVLTGRESLSLPRLLAIFIPSRLIDTNFLGCFLIFWLCIPFLNTLIGDLTEKQHIYITLLMLAVYTGLSTLSALPGIGVTMNYVSWFCILYFISSYVRLYPRPAFSNTVFWGVAAIAAFLISAASVVFCAWYHDGAASPFYFLIDSNKALALVVAFTAFMFFKDIRLPYSRPINAIGATTLGILLIHANSDAMRQWLWRDTLDNVGAYSLGARMPLHFFASVLGVFVLCSGIDMLRIRFIERPFLRFVDRHQSKWIRSYRRFETALCDRLHISAD